MALYVVHKKTDAVAHETICEMSTISFKTIPGMGGGAGGGVQQAVG